jgi:hypothetical protein
MTGSLLFFIVLPIMAVLGLGTWLGMVFWADAHPGHKPPAAVPGPDATGTGTPLSAAESGARPGSEPVPSPQDRKAA